MAGVGHTGRVTDVALHPAFGKSQSPAAVNVASAGLDSTIKLWSTQSGDALHTLSGHADRLARVAFHPSGRLLGSTRQEMSAV